MSTAASLTSRALIGVQALEIAIEVHIANGLPAFNIVGLPETVIRESRDRVRSALLSSAFDFPQQRITVNLAPADLPKHGTGFDLPIALGVLAASGQLPQAALDGCEFAGELALNGQLRHIAGALPISIACSAARRILMLPVADATEALLVSGALVYGARHLTEIVDHLLGIRHLVPATPGQSTRPSSEAPLDLADVHGQQHAKRALEIAAAGGHNLLMIGPPGTGKTMLARRLPGILPPLTESEAMQSAAIWSCANRRFDVRRWRERPFRAPHHTASSAAIVGGGSVPKPGEISLAHHGVLFLDELPEFRRDVLEALREPLESGTVTIARAAQCTDYPAQFQLVAAMNSCKCGLAGDRSELCRCTPDEIERYRNRVSGPLLDRFDVHIEVPREQRRVWLSGKPDGESSATVAKRVARARERQLNRAGALNSRVVITSAARTWQVADAALALLQRATDQLTLSARAAHRIMRVARTIADLEATDDIEETHVAEAITLRCLDRDTRRARIA